MRICTSDLRELKQAYDISDDMGSWPPHVGIIAIEITFPAQYVDQTELETFDGVSAGKYTVGLGQARMGFCTDREDINSLCLTVVRNLMDRNNIPYDRIGHLSVGTETLLDKSKSVKSVLMQLFEPHGVTDIEGIDTTNACYGGTAALFNALDWVESSAWDGRLALVVAGDIAVYAKGAARPTGGAGAVAMLVGPGAPLTVDRGLRATCMRHVYDFYKPDLSSEYPTVDGRLSIRCYLGALDSCYRLYNEKVAAKEGRSKGLAGLDAVLFHAPYCKLVQKAVARLMLNDFLQNERAANSAAAINGNGYNNGIVDEETEKKYESVARFAGVNLEDTYFDRDVEKAFMDLSREAFEQKTKPSLLLANQVGNMYTPSVYAALVSLLCSHSPSDLAGHRVALFSYGSGLAASMFSMTVTADQQHLTRLLAGVRDVPAMLDSRVKISPADFAKSMADRERYGHEAPMVPTSDTTALFPGTYYLEKVDDLHRRTYGRIENNNTLKE